MNHLQLDPPKYRVHPNLLLQLSITLFGCLGPQTFASSSSFKRHPFFCNHQPKCWTKTFGRRTLVSTSLEETFWVHILKMSLEGGLWQSIGILEVSIWSTANSATKAPCYQSWSLDFTVTKDASKSKKVSSVSSLLTFRTTKDPAYIVL